MNHDFKKTAMRVSLISLIENIVLAIVKFLAGIIAHSGAMVSDAVHSASDVFSTIIVMIGIRMASKEADEDHPYGHERMECVAAIVLATILAVIGLGIGRSAVITIFTGGYRHTAVPGVWALVAAVVSIAVKESMFWYTRHYAKVIESGALMADAWHHRSDALSSVGAFVGILFARVGYPVMDSIASLIICVFIIKAAYNIFKDAVDKMVDKSCDSQTEEAIREVVLAQDGVEGIDKLRTRLFGNKMYVDLEICADGNRPLRETHAIAENVHDKIEETFPRVKHIMVHVNPVE